MAEVAPEQPAKSAFSALDTLAVARELRALPKAWFDKAYDATGDRLLITFRVAGEGRRELTIAPGRFAVMRDVTTSHPEVPGQFAGELRKALTGAPLLGVNQPGGERLLELEFGRGTDETPALLVLELFGRGNILAVRDGRLVAVAHVKAWSKRLVKAGEPYVRPPSRKDPFKLGVSDVMGALERSTHDRATTLAARLSLGGPLAEEVLSRAALDPKAPAPTEAGPCAEAVVRTLAEILGEVGEPPQGFLYRRGPGGPLLDVSPVRSHRWEAIPGVVGETYPRFSEAAWTFFENLGPVVEPKIADVPEDPRAPLERLQTQQREAVQRLSEEIATKQKAAEAIYVHFPEVEARMAEARTGKGEESRLDLLLDGQTVTLDLGTTVQANAQRLYDEAKRLDLRRQGAQTALDSTLARLSALGRGEAAVRKVAPTVTGRAVLQRKRHFWFEKAPRWFITSEGWVIVGGRDARSNDALVKRYLGEKDWYSHAEIQGAPSVILKHPPTETGAPGPATCREACQWGLSYSKAWRVGLASGDAFWVAGDQVSKAGASGEFVARGSWVIHGTKHIERDLPLELSLGLITYEGETMIQSAPPSSFSRAGSRILWTLRPGEERERDELEKELARDLGVSRDLIQSLLPTGGVSARRT